MHTYTFDFKLDAALSIEANSEAKARRILADIMDCAGTNFGCFPNGDPACGEVSLNDNPVSLGTIDGDEPGISDPVEAACRAAGWDIGCDIGGGGHIDGAHIWNTNRFESWKQAASFDADPDENYADGMSPRTYSSWEDCAEQEQIEFELIPVSIPTITPVAEIEIIIEGGLIQSVMFEGAEARVTVNDYDVEGTSDEDDLRTDGLGSKYIESVWTNISEDGAS